MQSGADRKRIEREKSLKTSLALGRKRSELAMESVNAQLEQPMKHLERATERLVMWEQAMQTEEPPLNGDLEKVRLEVEKRLKKVKAMNAVTAPSYALTKENSEPSPGQGSGMRAQGYPYIQDVIYRCIPLHWQNRQPKISERRYD